MISQTRGTSPTKHLIDFQLSSVRVELKDFGTPGCELPAGATRIFHDMRRISKGLGVIPKIFEERMRKLNEVDFAEDTNFETVDDTSNTYEAATRSQGYESLWRDVVKTRCAARECHNESLSEPEWNGEVHSRLLRLALEVDRVNSNVWYRYATVASITDTSLLPFILGSGSEIPTRMQGKMVDFVIMLEPDETLHTDVICVLKQAYPIKSKRTINHIGTSSLRVKPIAVSIETKRASINEDTAHLQLSVWVSAHFTKLRQLMSLASPQPSRCFNLSILPLIVVQGHAWKSLITHSPNTSQSTVIILREIPLGSTATTLGTFIIIASLRRLSEWVRSEFRSWWVDCLQGGGSDGNADMATGETQTTC